MTQKKKLRRSNGEGYYFKINGRWYGQFALSQGNKLIRRSFSGESKLDVYKKGQQWLESAQLNTSAFSSQKTTLASLSDYWLNSIKKFSIRPKTFQKYSSTLNIYNAIYWKNEYFKNNNSRYSKPSQPME